jgi:hypothetical protein
MGRTADELCGCALAYRPEAPGSLRWIWTAERTGRRVPQIDKRPDSRAQIEPSTVSEPSASRSYGSQTALTD